ncbi:MAG: HAD family hydrolase [Gammaproteobacteria bacterium]|nr:HAD family hydrolase [Gammaproteobacteria bacterium]
MSGKPPNYQFILWDNDGVLVDTEQWYFAATREALAELGVDLPMDTYQQIMIQGRSSWELALLAGIHPDRVQHGQERRDALYQAYLRTQDLRIEGVLEVLAELAQHYQMAIVTTCKRRDFELIHSNPDLLQFMQFVLVREDYEESKPHPEPYLTALQKFSATPQQALVIEDSERGLRAARAAGIDCAVVDYHFTRSHDFSAAQYRLHKLTHLPQLLAT